MSDCVDGTVTSCHVGRHQQNRRNRATSASRSGPTQSRYLPSSSNSNHLHVAATSSSTPSSNAALSSSTASFTGRTAAANRHSNRHNIDSVAASSASTGTVLAGCIDGRLIVGAQGNHTAEDVDECKDDDEKRPEHLYNFEADRSLTRMTSPWRPRKQLTDDGLGTSAETSADICRRSSVRHSRKIIPISRIYIYPARQNCLYLPLTV